MTTAAGLITVWLDVNPEHEDEFTDWYRLEHIPQVVGLEGFVRGRRYLCERSPLRFLAWYETVDENVEPGPHFQALVANPTPWSQRVRRLYGERRERMNYRLAADTGAVAGPDAPWLHLVETDIATQRQAAFAQWCDQRWLPDLLRRPGVRRVRRYEATQGTPGILLAIESEGPDDPLGDARTAPELQAAIVPGVSVRERLCRLILGTVENLSPGAR